MSVFHELTVKSERIFEAFLQDADRYISTVGPAEKALAVCVFGLVLMYFIMRQPSDKKQAEKRSTGVQFFFAMVIVVLMGFGLGWLYSSDIETIVQNIPVRL